jgi:hypothetical protein
MFTERYMEAPDVPWTLSFHLFPSHQLEGVAMLSDFRGYRIHVTAEIQSITLVRI